LIPYKKPSYQNKSYLLLASLVFIVLLGAIDYATGFEIAFALFYLLPVSLTSWFIGKKTGITISIVSAAIWQIANSLAGEKFSSIYIPYWNAITRLGFFVVVTLLIVELRRAIDHERELSRTDYLTGALNSRAFSEIALVEISRLQRYHNSFAIAYLDLDNFKEINDQFGHNVGDTVLQVVVSTIKSTIRITDSVSRLGGDEFAILFQVGNADMAYQTISRLVKSLDIAMKTHQWPITFSAGVIFCPTPPASVNDMIRQVDQMMYRVKNNGKNGIACGTYQE